MADRILTLLVPGDIETRTGGYGYDREIVAGLRARGWAVTIITLPGAYPLPSEDERVQAGRALAALPPESLVLADGLAFGALPAEAGRERSRLRFVALVHHPLSLETGVDALTSVQLLGAERRALTNARGVVVTSHRTVGAVEAMAVPREHIAVVEPGTRPAPVATGHGDGTLRLLCVASLVPRKGHDTLFTALEGLASLDWQLTCVGRLDRDAAYAAELARRAATGPLAGRVTMAGELSGDALDAAYAAADLFVLPTHYEGYGMVVAEALARGIPVVSTPTGAIPELVRDRAGVLVPPGNAAALGAALAPLISDRTRLGALRDGAMQARAALPTWDEACARMEEALLRFGQR